MNTTYFYRHNLRAFSLVLAILIPCFFVFGFMVSPHPNLPIDEKTHEFELRIHIPDNFYLKFYDDSNTSVIYQSNYSIYLIMVVGDESDYEDIHHIKHFIDPELLSYFLDIEIYNLTYIQERYLFNGVVLNWEFEYNENNTLLSIDAFDFSIYNSTNHYNSMDFGNSYFIDIPLNETADIYVNEIDCYHEGSNIYRPYLNLTYNGIEYLERRAWNMTITF